MENKLSPNQPFLIRRRCLKSHHVLAACKACIDVCKKEALSILDNSIAFNATKCTGCGACISVCPTEAIISSDPKLLSLPNIVKYAAKGEKVSFACSLVKSDDAVKVPCLQQLDASLLLDAVSQGTTNIKLIKGDCADCVRYNKECSAESLANKVNQLTIGIAKVVLEEKEPEVNLGRRMFLGKILKTATPEAAAEETKLEMPPELEKEPKKRVPAKWQRTVQFLHKTANAEAAATVKLFRPVIDKERCSGCRLCTTVCPPGALKVKLDGEDLVFSVIPKNCIGCKICEDTCYLKAIKLVPEADPSKVDSSEPQVLVRLPYNPDVYSTGFEDKAREIFAGVPIYRT